MTRRRYWWLVLGWWRDSVRSAVHAYRPEPDNTWQQHVEDRSRFEERRNTRWL